MGPMATQAGTALTGGLTVPIMAIAAFAMKSASDVNGALRSITRETQLTGTAASGMKESFKKVASEVPASFNEVADSMTLFIQRTGLSGVALETLTKQALNMSRMMGTDVKATTDAVTTAFTAFQIPADQMATEMDHLFVLFQKTGVPMDEVTAAMDKMAPTSRALGLTFDETAATIAKFAAAGLPARQTVSMLTGFVTKMAEEGKNAGVEWKLMFERIKTGTATKDDVALFGASWTKVSDAVKTGKFDIDNLTEAMQDSKGAIDDTATKTATFGERLTMLRNRLEIAFAPIGSAIFDALGQLLTALQPVLNFVTFLAEAFGNLPGPIKMVIIVIAGIAAAIGPILVVVGMLMTSLAPVIALLTGGTLMASIMGIVGAVGAILIPLLPIIIAVVAIGAAFYLLYTYVKPFHDAVDGAYQVIKQMADLLMKGDFGGAFTLLTKSLSGIGDSLTKIDWGGIFAGILDSLSGVLDQALNFISNFDWEGAFKSAIDAIGKFFDSLFGGGGDSKGSSMDLGGQMSKSVDKAGPDIIGKLGNVLAKGFALLPMLFMKASQGLLSALEKVDWGSVAGKIFEAIKGVLITIIAFLKTIPWIEWAIWLFDQIKTVFVTIITWLKTLPWLDYANTVFNALKLVLGTIVVWLSGLPWGEYAIVVWNALVAALGQIVIWFISLPWMSYAQTVWNALITVLATFGSWLIGLVAGIGSSIWGWIVGAVGSFGSWIIGLVGGIGSSIWGWITGAVGSFGSWLIGLVGGIGGGIWSSIVGAVSGFGGYLIGQLSGLPGAITNAVVSGANAFAGAIVSSAQSAVGNISSAIAGAFSGISLHGHVPSIPLILPNGADFAEGGVVTQATFGRFGEAGREMLVPEKYFNLVAPELFNILPNPSGYTPPSATKGSTMSIPSVGGRVSASTNSSTVQYNAYVTVDSENVTRKVFDAFRTLEQYQQLR